MLMNIHPLPTVCSIPFCDEKYFAEMFQRGQRVLDEMCFSWSLISRTSRIQMELITSCIGFPKSKFSIFLEITQFLCQGFGGICYNQEFKVEIEFFTNTQQQRRGNSQFQ